LAIFFQHWFLFPPLADAIAGVCFVVGFSVFSSGTSCLKGWRWRVNISGELSEILCNGGEQHFIRRAAQPPEPQSIQFEDAFHVGKGHLDLFAFIPGAFEAWRVGATPILDGASPAVFGSLHSLARAR